MTPCDPQNPDSTCPTGEICVEGLGPAFGAPGGAVCLPAVCPSDDPALCGGDDALCGPCICTGDCSQATCANPGDGCGGQCQNVCPLDVPPPPGETGCTSDLHCPDGARCIPNPDGTPVCRMGCPEGIIKPPLCGAPGAPCGEECPRCSPECGGRQCGPDPACGTSCGTCSGGTYCDAAGQCTSPSTDPPPEVPDGQGGTQPLPELPPVSATPIGPVKGFFNVNDMGGAQYTVPIEVPEGRAGIEPALSLVYTGSKANTEAGVGWSLQGLSSITRCPRTYALDGYASPIKNDSNDALCIDGKRLVELDAAHRTTNEGIAEYRSLIDSFARVIAFQEPGSGYQLSEVGTQPRVAREQQGPDYFKVWTKEGRILTYGKSFDSLVLVHNGVRTTWLLNRVEDRAGNQMTVHYYNGCPHVLPYTTLPVLVRPTHIAYTGHGDTAGTREVRFTYGSRQDPAAYYLQGGTARLVEERLERITTFVKDKPVKNYRLLYSAGSPSVVDGVTECAGDDQDRCKPLTRFSYKREAGLEDEAGPVIGSSVPEAVQLDATGDGISDFLYTEVYVDGVKARPKKYRWIPYTVDAVVGVGSSFVPGWYGYAVAGAYLVGKAIVYSFLMREPTIRAEHYMTLGSADRQIGGVGVTDVNGIQCGTREFQILDYDKDGRDDILANCSLTQGLALSRSLGTGQFAPQNERILPWTQSSHSGSTSQVTSPIFMDVDGDGLEDAIRCDEEQKVRVERRITPQAGFELVGSHPPCWVKGSSVQVTLDIDGDGTPELLARFGDGWRALRFERATPNGAATLRWEEVKWDDVGLSRYLKDVEYGDFNGDGLLDAWRRDSDGTTPTGLMWLNTGNREFVVRRFSALPQLVTIPSGAALRTSVPFDVNADGRTDILDIYQRFLFEEQTGIDDWESLHFSLTPDSTFSNIIGRQEFELDQKSQVTHFFGDFDGDGNEDFLNGRQIAYGKGMHNLLLEKIEDGVGKTIEIHYDEPSQPGEEPHYKLDGCDLTWPEKCLPRVTGFVTSHVESVREDALLGSDYSEERTYSYYYENAIISLTGHGWLGFQKRTISGPDGVTTIENAPIVPLHLAEAGGLTAGSREPPYVYMFAGLPGRISMDQHHLASAIEAGSAAFWRQTHVQNHWEIAQSVAGRPFAKLAGRVTQVIEGERPAVVSSKPERNNSEAGELLSECIDSFQTNPYGNVTGHYQACDLVESTLTTTAFTEQPGPWLIANPDSTTVVGQRLFDVSKTRAWSFDYDARGLLTSVVRAPGDPSAQHATTYVRSPSTGNVSQIIETVASGGPPRTTTITYDMDDVFPRTITNSVGHQTTLVFDPSWGTPTTVIDPNGIVTRQVYDGLGLLAETHGPTGRTIYTYSALPMVAVETPAGRIMPRVRVNTEHRGINETPLAGSAVELDHRGRLVRQFSEGFGGVELVEERAYSPLDLLMVATAPHTAEATIIPSTTFTYDQRQRLTQAVRSDGSEVQYQYASVNTLAQEYAHWIAGMGGESPYAPAAEVRRIIDADGREDVVVADYSGKILRNVDGEHTLLTSRFTGYYYGPFGHLGKVFHQDALDERPTPSEFTYDDYGRLIGQYHAASGTQAVSYNGYDEVVETQDNAGAQHDGIVRTFGHDTLGRLTNATEVGSAAPGVREWIYDVDQDGQSRKGGRRS